MLCVVLCTTTARAQPSTLPMTPRRDTSKDKTNTGKWHSTDVIIYYELLGKKEQYKDDSEIHVFHRRLFQQPWSRDMGNPGSPILNLLFTPENRVGPTLGYHINNPYRFVPDSLKFYNTNKPYTLFSYQASGRQENIASVMHSQNVRPNWNVTADYRKISSPGQYQIQRNNHDNAGLSTNYKSLDKHYQLYGGIVYNKQQHDENGGVLNRDFLDSAAFNNRKIVPTAYENNAYSSTRSTVSNVQRDVAVMLHHTYMWGRTDTTFYEDDTSAYNYALTPRFGITHRASISSEKHTYKDLAPDSVWYTPLFYKSFPNKGTGYYSRGADSVIGIQKWVKADTRVLFEGFAGKAGNQIRFSAGAGIRYDRFVAEPVTVPIPDTPFFANSSDKTGNGSTYITGNIDKEALTPGAWAYGGHLMLLTTGGYAGNLSVDGYIGKKLKKLDGSITAGASQQLGSAPYSLTNYQNAYVRKFFDFGNESITRLYATAESRKLKMSGGISGWLVNNYIYLSDEGLPKQYDGSYTVPQVWLRKIFKVGSFYLDNEIVYQPVAEGAPVNVPAVMGRHQLSLERAVFRNALKFATGIEARYNTAYAPAGYNAQWNRFYYQNSDKIENLPEVSVFFNFRIKRFRAFIAGDNLQQLLGANAILYTGMPVRSRTTGEVLYNPVYAMPNMQLRFGFSWIMVN